MDRVIGIDLGTTNSVVAYYEQGQVVVIQNAEGSKTTPSVVFYKGPDEIIVGDLAKRQCVAYPKQAIRSVKRFMGVRFSEIADKRRGIQYDLCEGPDDTIQIDVGWKKVSPEEVSAEILKKMRQTAEEYFGEEVSKAVVTVPAYFNDNQRKATKLAGELAGLEIVRIVNEPTAAALAFGVDKKVEQRIAVFDFGGGTFDISILELDCDVFEVKSTHGDTYLGGDNLDESLFDTVLTAFYGESGIDLRRDLQAMQRLREAVEKVKCELSSTPETVLSIPFIAASDTGPVHLSKSVTRNQFNELIGPVMPRLIDCCRASLVDAHMQPRDITNVLLVGGSTRIPAVQETVRHYFCREPNRSLNPDEAVAMGAAIQASIVTGALREVLLLDVTPLSLGIELAGGIFSQLIPRNSSIPTSAHKVFTTVRDNQTSVKIHVLQGERKEARLNHSLGYFRLLGIAPAPKEIPEIDVLFQIDANGILNVQATDAMSGVSNSISIESCAQVTMDEATDMVHAAEEAAQEDRAFMRRAYLKNQADMLVESFHVLLADKNDPLDEASIKAIREAMFRFDVCYSGRDLPEVEEAYSRLQELGKQFQERILMQRLSDE